jgi:RNA polymerase sigma-70 factor (ECF subfamily)
MKAEKIPSEDKKLSIFNDLVMKESERYYHAVFRIVRSKEDAQEVMQEGFAKAFTKYNQFEGGASLSTWVYRIMVNEALQRLRTKRRKPEEVMDPFLPKYIFGQHAERILNWQDLPHERLEQKEFREFLIEVLNEFPEEFQAPYILKDFEQLSEKEIAETLGIPISTVKSRLHKTRLVLRKKVEIYLKS